MRKLGILVLAFALVVGMGFGVLAGNEAIVEQDNTANTNTELEAFVEQIGSSNFTEIEQISSGLDQLADVLQEGNSNEARITQTKGHSYNKKEAYIIQTGDDNIADIVQPFRNARGEIIQEGDSNEAEMYQYYKKSKHNFDKRVDGLIDQLGNDNTALIDQSMNSFGFSEALITQFGNENLAEIDQEQGNGDFYGEDSTAGEIAQIIQLGNNNEGIIDQDGLNNEAYIVQGSFLSNYGLLADVDENMASNNVASVMQDGNTNLAGVVQWGSNNEVDLEQYGNENEARIGQFGNNNMVKGVNETNDGLVFANSKPAKQFNGATFTGLQIGDDNKIGLRQGKDDSAIVNQNGDSNEALVYQFGGQPNTTTIDQDGNGNFSEVIQK